MITVQNILEWSKPHSIGEGKKTTIETKDLILSIVGGGKGLYGDFINHFEFAILDKKTNDFITKFFFPDNNDDVVGYMEGQELIDFLNKILRSDFQVR